MATFHLSIKSGAKGQALAHADYINRNGRHGKRRPENDLVATGVVNLPGWAENDPRKFWSSADKYERRNAAAYREFELALPAELDPKQQIELVEEFIRKQLPGKPSEYAVHAPIGALSGEPQPHAHIMFSDRKLDGIEREPEQHFRRFNRTYPEIGGAKKDSGGKTAAELRAEVVKIRGAWADLMNSHLQKSGHGVRVDHRSNRSRGIDVDPGVHLGPAKVRRLKQQDTAAT